MPVLTFTSSIPAPAAEVFAWHERPGAFQRLVPPWMNVSLVQHEGIREGQRAVLKIRNGPLALTWTAEHHDYQPGHQFCDRQVKGPFRSWDHVHRIEPDGPEACLLTDEITYTLPGGSLGRALAGGSVEKTIRRQFAYRHRLTKQDLALHRRYNPSGRRLRVAVSGASGLLGRALVSFLTTGGHEVLHMVRSTEQRAEDTIYWNHHASEIEADKLEKLDAVIHLAGESVYALRWKKAKKERIYASRVEGTRLLSTTLARLNHPPAVFLSASGISYYGHRDAEEVSESDGPGEHGFLTSVTADWEAAAAPAREAGLRTVCLRIGVVLTPAGGTLGRLLPLFRLGLGGWIGSGETYLSWIAPDDVLGILYHTLMTPSLDGPLNVVGPAPLPMASFSRTLSRVLHRPCFVRVPASLLSLLTGEMGKDMALTSVRASAERVQRSGYTFLYPDLTDLLRHQLGL